MGMPLQPTPSRLVVGGHSFIAELGNDPAIDFDRQLEIVNTCLDEGITCFDTTYEPERVALGRILAELKRRDQAQVMAWNFFLDPHTGQHLVGPRPYASTDIELLLSQLQTDHIDLLVVHPVEIDDDNERQTEVAKSWLAAGHVRSLGIWAPGTQPQNRFGTQNLYSFMVMPCNLAERNTGVFQAGKPMGWQTFATSPFGRGWLLDRLIAVAVPKTHDSPDTLRARLADAMLRFSLHHAQVDHVIVGIRKPDWIFQNLESVKRGPLPDEDMQWLLGLFEQVAGKV